MIVKRPICCMIGMIGLGIFVTGLYINDDTVMSFGTALALVLTFSELSYDC